MIRMEMTVHELFRDYPSAMELFIGKRMLCVGCPAQDFHTLGDVVRLYGYGLKSFMASLEKIIQNEGQKQKKDEELQK
jgi:hybrid cluster-associated redox disulfide protein